MHMALLIISFLAQLSLTLKKKKKQTFQLFWSTLKAYMHSIQIKDEYNNDYRQLAAEDLPI